MGTEHGVRWWLWGVVITLGVLSCLPVLTGAPCATDENCPLSQRCVNKRCETGSRSTGGGSGEAVRGVHELRCGDGLDDDADGVTDCADPDCEGAVCKAAAGDCDLEERCLAGVCPADAFQPSGASCRPVVGECDLEERCAGGPRCPADLSHCPAGQYCEPSGCVAQRALASACTEDAQCLSFSCVDGVCCDTRCEGACDTCGTGTCSTADAGVPGNPPCAPYVCNGTSSSCPLGCTDSSQCVSTSYCAPSGNCLPRSSPGAECTTAAQCATGFCVAGRCCDTACTGACEVCDSPAAPGRCIPAQAGATGDPSCAPYVCGGSSPVCPSGCTTDLQCATGLFCGPERTCVPALGNGAACTTGNQCLSGHCVDGFCCDTACDGSCDVCSATPGSCRTAPAGTSPRPSCSGALCNGTQASCPSSCAGSGCANGYNCTNGVCVSNGGNGAACANASNCTSGNCVGGVCCNSACGGACDTCETGTCSPVGAGAPGAPSCAPYLCNGSSGACPVSCSSDAQCASDRLCQAGRCVARLGNGAGCTDSALCASGRCVDGVCCNTSCSGACVSCALSGSAGTCTPRPAGTDPENGCANTSCNGAGACIAGCSPPGSCPAACGTNGFCTANGVCGPTLLAGEPCTADCQCASDRCTTFYRDVDGDGFGQAGAGERRCGEQPPAAHATRGGDCDDTNAQVHPGAPELPGDEVDSDCNGRELCYRDDDGDGFRVENTIVSNDLSCDDGHEARASEPSGDCCDSDADVHPGQLAYFDDDRRCGGQRYDYDCDGVESPRWTQSSAGGPACTGSGGATCVEQPGAGWLGPVPACGRHDDFSQCSASDDACVTSVRRRTQSCR